MTKPLGWAYCLTPAHRHTGNPPPARVAGWTTPAGQEMPAFRGLLAAIAPQTSAFLGGSQRGRLPGIDADANDVKLAADAPLHLLKPLNQTVQHQRAKHRAFVIAEHKNDRLFAKVAPQLYLPAGFVRRKAQVGRNLGVEVLLEPDCGPGSLREAGLGGWSADPTGRRQGSKPQHEDGEHESKQVVWLFGGSSVSGLARSGSAIAVVRVRRLEGPASARWCPWRTGRPLRGADRWPGQSGGAPHLRSG